MKVAFLGFPHLGGTFTLFRHLRAGLGSSGIVLSWLGIGRAAHQAFDDPAWVHERPHGKAVGSPDDPDAQLCRKALQAIDEGGFDCVFVNVLTSRVEMSVARYLRRDIARIMIVHNITQGTYGAASAIRDHVHATVAVSGRIRADLVRNYSFPPDRTATIPHGIEIPPLLPNANAVREDLPRLIYLGRIDDPAKGVFWLPKILDRLPLGINLAVAGDGPDLPKLRARCERLAGRVTILGGVPAERVHQLLSNHDILIMPSRFEGFGLSLLEAMAARCVPVVTRIAGVTDEIVTDGQDGALFRAGDVGAAADAIRRLAANPGQRRAMGTAARETVIRRFAVDRMAARYSQLIEATRMARPSIAPPCEIADWHLPAGMRGGIRTRIPEPVKNALRTFRERLIA